MKIILKALILTLLILVNACNLKDSKTNGMKVNKRTPITSLDEANKYISKNFNEVEETLWISQSLNDPMGMNMAIIADGILKLGYMPDGFEQKEGYRIYKFIKDK